MSADSYGTKGEPQFSDSGAPDTAVDPTLASEYAAVVGNRVVGTSTERAAFSTIWPGFSGPWDGLEFHETDTGLTYVRASGAWVARFDDTGWATPTLLNGWSNLGAGYVSAQYRRLNRVVYVQGTIGSGTVTDGTVLFALPAGFRPAASMQFAVAAGSPSGTGRIEAQAGGNVVARTITSPVSLQICFPVA